jgi:hypothetical protein
MSAPNVRHVAVRFCLAKPKELSMHIIDNRIRDLVARIEEAREQTPAVDKLIAELVFRIHVACLNPAVLARAASYNGTDGVMERLSRDADGFMPGFDPLTQEQEFLECWHKYGIVISKGVIPQRVRTRTNARIEHLLRRISDGECDVHDRLTWDDIPVDSAGVPLLSRGFFEVYHDHSLAMLRQAVRVYVHYALIWSRADLWTTFDRYGLKLPGHGESKALPLHVDQNPNVHPAFRTVQGVLALSDCPARRGTFVGVPGSKTLFPQYARMAKNAGEYVELDLNDDVAPALQQGAQLFPLRGGDLISWDSRTTHANSENFDVRARMVAYIAAGPARMSDEAAVAARAEAFRTGVGSNVRDAMMHASKRPRFTDPQRLASVREPERLTLLGRLLYGQQSYADFI